MTGEYLAPRPGLEPLIRVEGLTKHFDHGGRRLDVLRGIDLTLYKGEMVSVVGRSGAGKSTLLHILGTIDRPTAGRIFFEGKDINRLSMRQLAEFRNRTVGFVFQFHHLLPELTAKENVMMPALIQRESWRKADAMAGDLLTTVGLRDRLSHRPSELSGGEQQRVALARAVVLKPRLLLADEPTGNLDSYTGEAIIDLFFKINQEIQTTMLIVTHNPELAVRMNRKLRMVDGRIVESEAKEGKAFSSFDAPEPTRGER